MLLALVVIDNVALALAMIDNVALALVMIDNVANLMGLSSQSSTCLRNSNIPYRSDIFYTTANGLEIYQPFLRYIATTV